MSEESAYGVPRFEQGPIRPPSEAYSLLLRVTRNCPWNQCSFCPVYKGSKFSRRTVDEVKDDIRAMKHWADQAKSISWRLGYGGEVNEHNANQIYSHDPDNPYLRAILLWMLGSSKTAFLQDADSLIIKPEDLADILGFFRKTFPSIERVTTYSRSSTLARQTAEELGKLKNAGLDRVHVGLESGSDKVLKMMKKGATAEKHVTGGRRVKQAGLELSEYVMPGLGGKQLSEEHAKDTAKVLNQIDPDFIRIRTLAVPPGAPLSEMVQKGEFEPPNDLEMARELRLFIENLNVHSTLVSDHMLNLFQELEGPLSEDRPKMLSTLDRFLEMDTKDQLVYIIGKRVGLFEKLSDLSDPSAYAKAEQTLDRLKVTSHQELQQVINQVVSRFI